MRRSMQAVGAALALGMAGVAAAQDAPAGGCGMVMLRESMSRGARDSLVRSRALIELERVTEARARAATAGAVTGAGRVRLLGSRGWLGVQASEISETRLTGDGRIVRYCEYPVVVSVEPGSPAARGGVEAGDTIVAYNGTDLRQAGEIALDELLVPDDTLRVSVRRGSRALTLPVVVGRAPGGGGATLQRAIAGGPGFSYVIVNGADAAAAVGAAQGMAPQARVRVSERSRPEGAPLAPPAPTAAMIATPGLFSFALGGPSTLAGAQIVGIDDDLGDVVGTRTGVLVVKVVDGTPAATAGLRSGDVILSAGGTAVTSPGALQRVLYRFGDERTVSLRVVRRGKARDVAIRW